MSNTFKSEPIKFEAKEAQPAPKSTVGLIAWLRDNLFSSPLNAIITLATVFLLARVIPGIVDWAFISATWSQASNYGELT